MKLHSITTSDLQYVEAGQFIQRLLTDIKERGLDIKKDPNLAGYLGDLQPAFNQFNLALQQIAGQKETLEILALDLVRDRCILSLKRQISVYEYDTEPEMKNAYQEGMRIMKKYKGIEHSNYEAESLSIRNLVEEWYKPENTKS